MVSRCEQKKEFAMQREVQKKGVLVEIIKVLV